MPIDFFFTLALLVDSQMLMGTELQTTDILLVTVEVRFERGMNLARR